MHKWAEKISDYGTQWETRNHLMTAALEQAAHDKHLLYNAGRSKNFELTYPEYVTISYSLRSGGAGEPGTYPKVMDTHPIVLGLGVWFAWLSRFRPGAGGEVVRRLLSWPSQLDRAFDAPQQSPLPPTVCSSKLAEQPNGQSPQFTAPALRMPVVSCSTDVLIGVTMLTT